MFSQNLGPADQALRTVGGFVVFVYAYWTLNQWAGAIAAVMMVTGMLGNCPLYSVLRISTNSKQEKAGDRP